MWKKITAFVIWVFIIFFFFGKASEPDKKIAQNKIALKEIEKYDVRTDSTKSDEERFTDPTEYRAMHGQDRPSISEKSHALVAKVQVSDRKQELAHAEDQPHKVTTAVVACEHEEEIKKIRTLLRQNDFDAVRQSINDDDFCIILPKDSYVYVDDYSVWAGNIKIRRKGEAQEFWTFSNAIES